MLFRAASSYTVHAELFVAFSSKLLWFHLNTCDFDINAKIANVELHLKH